MCNRRHGTQCRGVHALLASREAGNCSSATLFMVAERSNNHRKHSQDKLCGKDLAASGPAAVSSLCHQCAALPVQRLCADSCCRRPPGCGPVAGPGGGQHAGHAAHRPRMQPVGAFSGMSYSPKRSLQAHSCKLASSVNMKARQSCDRLLYTALAGSLSSAAHRFDL